MTPKKLTAEELAEQFRRIDGEFPGTAHRIAAHIAALETENAELLRQMSTSKAE